MTDDDVLAEFRAADALLEGHFLLSSGLHSPRYLQCARVLMDPRRGARLAEALVARLPGEVKALIDAGADAVVLDARRFDEYRTMSIPTATSVPGAELVLRVLTPSAVAP